MVVASIALLVALGGTSVAAVTQLRANSVGKLQLRNNAVGSAEVINRSLKAVDFARNQLPRGPRGLQGAPGAPGASGPPGTAGPSGPAGVAAPGYVAQVISQTGASSVSTNSTNFVNLSGGAETIVVPTGQTARIYATFSAESTCTGPAAADDMCSVRITVDGNELNPVAGDDFAFDSTDGGLEGDASSESHAIVRISETLAAGSHPVQVEIAVTSGAELTIDDWALVIQRVRLS
jgi:hypothetical protein